MQDRYHHHHHHHFFLFLLMWLNWEMYFEDCRLSTDLRRNIGCTIDQLNVWKQAHSSHACLRVWLQSCQYRNIGSGCVAFFPLSSLFCIILNTLRAKKLAFRCHFMKSVQVFAGLLFKNLAKIYTIAFYRADLKNLDFKANKALPCVFHQIF